MRVRFPSPATVLALVALFVALGGTAVAAGVVPKARFALNSAKLQGKTAAQVAAVPGPATSAAALIATRTKPFSIGAQNAQGVTATCESGEKVVGGGYGGNGVLIAPVSAPNSDGTAWTAILVNVGDSATSGNVYAVCLK
jgi:hypothetical protein